MQGRIPPDLDTLPVFKNRNNQSLEGQQPDGNEELNYGEQLGLGQSASNENLHASQAASSLKASPNTRKIFKAKNVDEQPVPAAFLQNPIDFNTVTEDNYLGGAIGGSEAPDAGEGLRYTDIKSTLKSKADAMLPFFGEECTVRIFHRRW